MQNISFDVPGKAYHAHASSPGYKISQFLGIFLQFSFAVSLHWNCDSKGDMTTQHIRDNIDEEQLCSTAKKLSEPSRSYIKNS
jgi:hypothetical protein